MTKNKEYIMENNINMEMDSYDYWEEYFANLEKPEEEYEREKIACCSFYDEYLNSNLKEIKTTLFKCLDALNVFLARMNISEDTFLDYIHCSTYDKHFLRKANDIKIEEDLLRDYYSSVL